MGFCKPSTVYCKNSTGVPTDKRETESDHRYPRRFRRVFC